MAEGDAKIIKLRDAILKEFNPKFTADDLAAMFGMFDVTRIGVVKGKQIITAYKSIAGETAEIEGVDEDKLFNKQEFIDILLPHVS